MIVLTVQSFNGQPAAGLAASFDELGGTVGRADTNQLVLPDPERSISRVHAQVVFRHGHYALIDRGSNPVLVNGQPLGNGREAPLKHGDTLQIGGYLIGVTAGHQTTAKDLFADLFGDTAAAPRPAPAPFAAPPAAPVAQAPAARAALPPVFAPPPPMAAPAWPPAGADALFGSAAPPPAPGASQIPEDWDPFAPAPAPSSAQASAGTAAAARPASGDPFGDLFGGTPVPAAPTGNPYIPDLPLAPPSRSDSLDALFDLGGAASPSPAADPFAGSPFQAPVSAPNTAADADPLRALGMAPPPVAAPVSDHVSELNTPWSAPPLREAATPPRPAPAPLPAAPAPLAPASAPATTDPAAAGRPAGAIVSWDQPSRETKVVTLPGVRRVEAPAAAPAAEPPPAAAPAVEPAPRWPADDSDDPVTTIRPAVAAQPPAPLPPRPPVAPPPVAAFGATGMAGGDAALLAALADGLGMAPEALRGLDPAQMQLVGRLLREATRGAVELLVARAALKREMRADVTMIVARENNPLKFSPNVDVALKHLLGAPTPGFMGPTDAMRDAFDDLRAHQLGVMAGMRAALDGVLARFDPAVLEGKITKRGGLGGLLPSGRKAQLWEQFQQLYTQLSAEAADDFQALFGRAFREAYEAHIDRLRDTKDGG